MSADYDVAIVGAGFAGLTAARELSMRGLSVVVCEGRDRIGGRTWTDDRLGHRLEMGGTYVHWSQPFVWAEITRYGLAVVAGPTATKAYWLAGGELCQGAPKDWFDLAEGGLTRALSPARDYFPNACEAVGASPGCADLRDQNVTDYVDGLGLTEEQKDMVKVFWALSNNGPNTETSALHMLRGVSMYGNSWRQLLEAAGTYKIQAGTSALASAIADDIRGEVRLGTRVVAVERGKTGTTLVTESDDALAASAVIVTVPRNALRDIEFTPPLSEGKRRVIAEGQVSQGVKVWARLRGRYEPFFAFAMEDTPLQYAQVEDEVEGDTIVVAFGANAHAFDGSDREAVEAELRRWIPDADVMEATCHDWVGDPFSQQTWFVPRPGQLAHLEEVQRPEGGIYLAGGDYATLDPSTIDGAIEGGLTSARRAMRLLG